MQGNARISSQKLGLKLKLSTPLPSDISLARCLRLHHSELHSKSMLITVENIVELIEHTQDSNRLQRFN